MDVLLTAQDISARIDALAARLSGRMRSGEWTAVVILLGATPFGSDLMRALARHGVDVHLDALWLESYGDARTSSGRVLVRADLSRPVEGRNILLLDDVFDTGRTLAFARAHLLAKGANSVVTAVFARKSDPQARDMPDDWAFDAPDRFLVGYGMDDAGALRGLPYLGAL
jgi:hypoxanthine phosphoribosyltransferase